MKIARKIIGFVAIAGVLAGCSLNDTPSATPANASDALWVTEKVQAQFEALDCSKPFRAAGQVDDPSKPLVTCADDASVKYILGPVEVFGLNISNASSGTVTTQTGASTNDWAVNLEFDAEGTTDRKVGVCLHHLHR